MKKIYLLLACAMCATMTFAQEAEAPAEEAPVSPWKVSGIVGLNANATGLWNWAAGGNNAVAGVTFGKLRLLYEENSMSWESNLDVEYGLSWVDQKYDKLQKTSDHLKFDTKFGWEFAPTWFLTASAAFQTQMDLGRAYPGDGSVGAINSMILAPSYTDISVGIDWKKSVNGADFSLYLSPIAGRIATAYVSSKNNDKYTKEMIDAGVYAEGQDFRTTLQEANGTWKYDELNNKKYMNALAELGLNFKATINYTYKDFKLATALTLFTPYKWDKVKMYNYTVGEESANYTEKQMQEKGYDIAAATYLGFRDNNRRFGNFDVDWTVMLSYQFLKCLNVTLSTDLKYINGLKIDKADANGVVHSAERVQFMGVLGLGVGYSF
ncbi:MAG: DUF3078 domain-containing protein [Paludibacteraceae bacterium]|nr:DUF3078 domain-containing protein [Paludibacteraceae bacterium]